VILIPFDAERALEDYYAGALDIKARFVNIPLYADEATVLAILDELGDAEVELLTWFQLPADARGMYPCLLTATSYEVGAAQTFFGLMTQRFHVGYRDPAWDGDGLTMQAISAEPHYRAVNFTDAAYLASPNGLCLRTGWSLTQETDDAMYTAASVLNPLGAAIARDDAEIARSDNVGTAHWNRGDAGQAYNLLVLPEGATRQDYGIAWTVYSDANPSGYDVLDADGNPTGKMYTPEMGVSASGVELSDDIESAQLLADTVGETGVVETGIALDVTLIVPASDDDIAVTLTGEDWSLAQTVSSGESARLTWVRFVIPPGNAGEATLMIGGDEIATYTVVDPPRNFDAPDPAEMDITIGEGFDGIGKLVGIRAERTDVSPENPPEIDFIWEAMATTQTAYTVFAQLISEDGLLIAQSDSQPVDGERPTTSWVEGEYIVDRHRLNFNVTDYTGVAYVIVGFYDANGRVETELGTDHLSIPLEFSVSPSG
jgi:hypothetical protein